MITTAGNTDATGDIMAGRCCSGTGMTDTGGKITIQTGATITAGTSTAAEMKTTREAGAKVTRETGTGMVGVMESTETIDGAVTGKNRPRCCTAGDFF